LKLDFFVSRIAERNKFNKI